MAARLLAVSPREVERGVSGGPVYDGGHRHARRSHAREKDDSRDAGRSKEWRQQDATDLIEDREQGRSWRGQAGYEADRRVHGPVFLFVLAGGREGIVSSG